AAARARDVAVTQVGGARERTGRDHMVLSADRDAETPVGVVRVTPDLVPQVLAVGVVLGDEPVVATEARARAAAEVDTARTRERFLEATRDRERPGRVDRQA